VNTQLLIHPDKSKITNPHLGLVYSAGTDRETRTWEVFKEGEPYHYTQDEIMTMKLEITKSSD
jgi:hypothetical protein